MPSPRSVASPAPSIAQPTPNRVAARCFDTDHKTNPSLNDSGITTPAPKINKLSPLARVWLGLALGSLLLAGLLSLSVVLGRLPGFSRIIDDPLFFKRCLVVHVDLALVVWFYSFASALLALRSPSCASRFEWFVFGLSATGVVGLLAGGLMRGATPVLANYIPVIDHPIFLTGLGLFFAGVLLFALRSVWSAPALSSGASILPPSTAAGVQACAVALALAAATWLSSIAALPTGLDRRTYFELAQWGTGHVLQVTNVCAMLAVWLWLIERATDKPVLSGSRALALFALLIGPHFAMPLLSWHGAAHRTYVEGATWLMRWTLFPVVLIVFTLCIRHLKRHRVKNDNPANRLMLVGFSASAGLTLLGFILGACIRGSTTLVPAHYHASLGGVTAAFMAAAYLLCDLLKPRSRSNEAFHSRWHWGTRQLKYFGIGQALFALGFAVAGIYGLGRKAYASEQKIHSIGAKIGLSVMGVGGLAAAVSGALFLILVLRSIFSRSR